MYGRPSCERSDAEARIVSLIFGWLCCSSGVAVSVIVVGVWLFRPLTVEEHERIAMGEHRRECEGQ